MGKRATEPAPVGLVTSDTVQAGANLRRHLVIGAIGLVLIGSLGAGGWYTWTYTSLFHKTAPAKQVPDYSTLPPKEAIKAAQTELQNASTAAEKAAAYNNLGQAYMRNNQPSQAVNAYEQAVGQNNGSSGSSGDIISEIATRSQLVRAYEAAGEKAKAITTLEEIIAILQASNEPQKDRTISRYEADLSYLEGPPK